MTTSPLCNVELKARIDAGDRVRAVAVQLATARLADQHQIDTYFVCLHGRLKLREIDAQRAELIWYERPDQTAPKPCRYCLIPVDDPAAMKHALQAALGVHVVVEKHREIYLFHNVRIHLDQVTGLGQFLEFEAVLGAEVTEDKGRRQVEQLQAHFGIATADLLTGSYADL